CDSDDARACAELARRYRAGDGVPRDLAKAVEAMQDGCEAGEPALCVEAGRAVLRGEGVKSDPARARELFSDACTQRPHAGCLDPSDLCSDYLAGYEVLAEPSLARAPCEKACNGGVGEACDNLSDMYQDGSGVPKDESQAAALRKRACSLGDRDACDVRE